MKKKKQKNGFSFKNYKLKLIKIKYEMVIFAIVAFVLNI